MRIIILLALLIAGTFSSGSLYSWQKDQDLSYVFDLNAVPAMTITVSAAEWNNLLRLYDKNKFNEDPVHAAFEFEKNGNKEKLGDIGLRIKGNVFSRYRPEGRPGDLHEKNGTRFHLAHFRFVFDEDDKKARFHGLKSVAMKFFNGDPSYVREIYAMDLFQRYGVYTAPLSSYCRLYIRIKEDDRPVYFGVYRMNEAVDEVFLAKRFPGNDRGFLWKCLYPADLTDNGIDGNIGIKDSARSYKPGYDLKTRRKQFELAKKILIGFARTLSGKSGKDYAAWVERAFDVKLFLKAQAVNALLGMWDDYWCNKNNYYLYFDNSGRAYFIPYDYDNCLGTGQGDDPGTRSALEWGQGYDRPLMNKPLEVEGYKKYYSSCLAELIDQKNDYFNIKKSMDRVRAWDRLIQDYVKNDTGQYCSIEDQPARWGNTPYYRILDEGEDCNFFKIRIRTVKDELGLK